MPNRVSSNQAPDFLTTEELLSVFRIAKLHSTRNWAALLVCYQHALRASEVCALTLADLNFKSNSVKVIRLKGSLETVQPLFEHKGEPLLDERKALKAWLRERQDDGSDALFNSNKGGRMSRSQLFRIFQSYAEQAGLPEAKRFLHILKHSRASHCVGKMEIALVKQLLGHKSITSTMVYAHASDQAACAEAQRVSMAIF
jgi:site-specific recombinase XerD